MFDCVCALIFIISTNQYTIISIINLLEQQHSQSINMKFQLNILAALIATSNIIFVINAAPGGPPPHVQPPPQAKGHYKSFTEGPNGVTSVELYENGPTLQCTMNAIRSGGKSNARYCQSGLTTMTVVDAECPVGQGGQAGIFDNPSSLSSQGKKKCFAASIVDGELGKIYHVNSAGEVNERSSSDYPQEEHLEDNMEPSDYDDELLRDDMTDNNGNVSSDDIRRLLRGSSNNDEPTARDLQGSTPVIDVLVRYVVCIVISCVSTSIVNHFIYILFPVCTSHTSLLFTLYIYPSHTNVCV